MAKENINEAARLLGRKGGLSKSEAKAEAARENGREGGWPKGRPRAVPYECKCGAVLKLKFSHIVYNHAIYLGTCENCGAKNSEQVGIKSSRAGEVIHGG
jgi:hypothetical protein